MRESVVTHRTPSGPTVAELLQPGQLIRCVFGYELMYTAEYRVAAVEGPFTQPEWGDPLFRSFPRWTIRTVHPARWEDYLAGRYEPGWWNMCVAVDGQILHAYEQCRDRVEIIEGDVAILAIELVGPPEFPPLEVGRRSSFVCGHCGRCSHCGARSGEEHTPGCPEA